MSIKTIESLHRHLNMAMTVEHSTLPPYLCALYSIPDGTNEEAASVIRTVAMEEMLHMVLVANLTNAVGGTVRVSEPNFVPSYPRNLLPGSSVHVELQKFSRSALKLFMKIEKPEDQPKAPSPHAGIDLGYTTIGQFYQAVRKGLKSLVDEFGEATVFRGDPMLQVTSEYYYGGAGHLFMIHNLDDANRAIEEIVDQGEGLPGSIGVGGVRGASEPISHDQAKEILPGDTEFLHRSFNGFSEPAHYFRFQEIHEGQYYQKGDTPSTGPRGPEFPVDWHEALNMQVNPKSSKYEVGSPVRKRMDEFNGVYSRLIERLQLAFTGQPQKLMDAVGDMYELKHRATELMRIPNPIDHGATTVGPSFEFTPLPR